MSSKIQITNAREQEESRKMRLLLNTDFPLIELQTEFSVTTTGAGCGEEGNVATVVVFVGQTYSSLRLFSEHWEAPRDAWIRLAAAPNDEK